MTLAVVSGCTTHSRDIARAKLGRVRSVSCAQRIAQQRSPHDTEQRQRGGDVHEQVERVIAPHVAAIPRRRRSTESPGQRFAKRVPRILRGQRVADRERQRGHGSARDRSAGRRAHRPRQRRQVADVCVLDNRRLVVEHERPGEAAGIGDDRGSGDERCSDKGRARRADKARRVWLGTRPSARGASGHKKGAKPVGFAPILEPLQVRTSTWPGRGACAHRATGRPACNVDRAAGRGSPRSLRNRTPGRTGHL